MGLIAEAIDMNVKNAVIEWIEHILDRKNWSGTDLARRAEVSPSTILRILNNPDHKFVPTLRTMQKISTASGTAIPPKVIAALNAGGRAAPEEAEDEGEGGYRRKRYRPQTVVLKYVSSLPAALQAATSANRETTYVAAPPQLDGDDTAFAFYMPEDTFDPWIKQGMLLFATKRRDPMAGDTIVITDKNGKTRVRLLMGIDEAGFKLSKSMPVKEDERIPFDDIKDIGIVQVLVKM